MRDRWRLSLPVILHLADGLLVLGCSRIRVPCSSAWCHTSMIDTPGAESPSTSSRGRRRSAEGRPWGSGDPSPGATRRDPGKVRDRVPPRRGGTRNTTAGPGDPDRAGVSAASQLGIIVDRPFGRRFGSRRAGTRAPLPRGTARHSTPSSAPRPRSTAGIAGRSAGTLSSRTGGRGTTDHSSW